ncbi:mitochondrial protein of LYR family [Coccomyxa subellipsoidea C-169]|uniref:Mitochondrial protein of LYR family n=1 Tax=Coccomyxa subellipsoidea (strain C-169) TaxID=574566 RepID=I0Z768_COCSC|nr:mitochondrial protein of LYR family [Coccomyxa subellipsoidea C-169]EIE26487.1 mitochondrial protein of LYR family [Coccomyxa subellipsoidea C-169]|eukprot:XP_005651031.1 mitochondrial protein of LYR family [Coccomyxa subellipsoidea C-169]
MARPAEIISMYRSFLKHGAKFPNYNIREYVRRKAMEGFRAHKGETDEQTVSELVQDAKTELEVVKRQSMVYSLYARQQKSIMDIPLERVLKDQAEIPSADLKAPGL